jgi:hypothetical protein
MSAFKTRLFVATAVAFALIGGAATAASDGTLKTGVRSGPIVHEETTIGQVKKWFGPPDGSASDSSPCGKMTMSVWGQQGLMVAHRNSNSEVIITGALQPTSVSGKHGTIEWKTAAGLEFGDTKTRMKRLYPNATKKDERSGGEAWQLQKNRRGTLMAILDSGKVAALSNQTKCN